MACGQWQWYYPSVLHVGLTGGIACGKSYALRELRKQGASTIDADQIAHQVIEPGKPAYKKILAHFGPGILQGDQAIDRKKLGEIVFSDEAARQQLNQIVHPYVFQEEARLKAKLETDSASLGSPILVVDAALMIESGSYQRYAVVIVIYCHPAIQIQRLMRRDQISEQEALARIQAQMPILEKIHYGDYIVENSGKLSETRDQIRQIFAELLIRYEEGLG